MSALEQFLMELLLAQHVDMLRAEAEARARVMAVLVLMQRDIVSLLANAPELSALGKAGKNALLRETNDMIAAYFGKAQLELDLVTVAETEARAVQAALAKVVDLSPGAELPAGAELRAAITEARAAASAEAVAASIEIRLGVALPTENYLRTLASDVLIQGSPAKNWWLRQAQDVQFKLANEIRMGAAQGETNAQIIKRVVGQEVTAKAPAEGGPPGIMPLARRNAAAIVQTSMQTVAAQARRKTMEVNADIANGIMQVSTLDGHTSLTCIAYSGATWDLDYEPMGDNDLPYNGGVPRHWGCRSAETLILKTLREMGIDMDEPDPGTRASSSGQISAKTTFADYLKMKGEAYQNEVLGPGRAELFRAGKLSPRDLVDMSGRPLKLEELKEKASRTFNQPSGAFTIYDPGFKRVAPDVSTPARAAAVKFEETIRRNDHETGAFFGKNGALQLARSGEPDRVSFKVSELRSMNGALFTHNHPGGSTFSVADVQNASFTKLSELRAVTPGYRHIMTAENGWPAEAAIQRAFDLEAAKARRDVDTMVRSGELSVKYATTEIYHLMWARAAPKLGLTYLREAS
jgi:hypothetical protein